MFDSQSCGCHPSRGIACKTHVAAGGTQRVAPVATAIREHRPAKPWEIDRDRAVLRLCMTEWERLPEPKPDLPTWLNGASTALLLIRQVSS